MWTMAGRYIGTIGSAANFADQSPESLSFSQLFSADFTSAISECRPCT